MPAFLDVVRGIRAAIDEMTRESRPTGGPARGDGTPPPAESGALGGDKIIVEVIINPRDSTESPEVVVQRAVQRIREAVPGVEDIGVRKGSIILTLRLAKEQGERLRELIQDGMLEEFELMRT